MLPRRTKETGLTEDQLILLDAMFDGSCRVALLRRGVFCQHFNFERGHSLDDESLNRVLDDMVKAKMIECRETPRGPVVSITASGGSLWETERQPSWDLYVSDEAHFFREDGSSMLTVLCPSKSTRDEYFTALNGAYGRLLSRSRVKTYELARVHRIVWKKLSPWFVTIVHPLGEETSTELWRQEQQYRGRWWRTINELAYIK